MSKAKKAILALVFANIIWGSSPAITKWALHDLAPFTLGFLRFFISLVIIVFIAHKHIKVSKKNFLLMLVAGFLMTTVNIGFFIFGVEKTASINVPIIGSSGPILLLLGSLFFLHEKIKKRVLLGNLIGLSGVLFIVLQPLFQDHGALTKLTGNVFIIVATVASALGTILAKKIIKNEQPSNLLFWSFLTGTLAFSPFFINDLQTVGLRIHMQGLIGIVFSVLLPSLTAYFLYYWSLKYFPASEVGIFTYLDPFVAIIIAGQLLGEIPNPIFILGGALVFLGIFIAEGRLHYHPLHKLLMKT